jgi:hypothetical protein
MPIVICINAALVFILLWVAFSPRFRPMSWSTFYLNLGAAALNLLSVLHYVFFVV